MSGRRLLRGLVRSLQNLLGPGICAGCGVEIGGSAMLCETCSTQLVTIANPCQSCAQPNAASGTICPACRRQPPHWQAMTAPLHYQGLARDFLLQLKNANARHLATGLCEQTVDQLLAKAPHPQALLPVPLHPARLVQRGYNQAHEIARCWSNRLDIPVDHRALQRLRETPAQAGLSRRQRRQNVAGAFRYRPRQHYRHVAVVDDIITTGSTVSEIARLLQRHGVEHVEVWAVARTWRHY